MPTFFTQLKEKKIKPESNPSFKSSDILTLLFSVNNIINLSSISYFDHLSAYERYGREH